MNIPFEKSSFWDKRFGQESFIFGREPNDFFKHYIESQWAGNVLLPAEGEGRNAVFAASQNWKVKAVDFSEEGRKKALTFASDKELSIDYSLDNIATFEPEEKFDLIAFIFIHPSPSLRKALFRRYMGFLKPEGKILLEVFSERQFLLDTGGPGLKEFLYTREELEDIFRIAKIESLTEQEIELKAGPYPGATGHTLQMLVSLE